MKDELNNWLAQKGELPAVVAAGIIHPDKTIFSQIFSPDFTEQSADQLWLAISEMIGSAKNQSFPEGRWAWSFDRFAVHCKLRHDGTCLATLTHRQLSSAENSVVVGLLSEFHNL